MLLLLQSVRRIDGWGVRKGRWGDGLGERSGSRRVADSSLPTATSGSDVTVVHSFWDHSSSMLCYFCTNDQQTIISPLNSAFWCTHKIGFFIVWRFVLGIFVKNHLDRPKKLFFVSLILSQPVTVTVTVTKVFILRFLLKDRKCITESCNAQTYVVENKKWRQKFCIVLCATTAYRASSHDSRSW